jgi:hypothetical protein
LQIQSIPVELSDPAQRIHRAVAQCGSPQWDFRARGLMIASRVPAVKLRELADVIGAEKLPGLTVPVVCMASLE